MAMSSALKSASVRTGGWSRPVAAAARRWRGTVALETDDAFGATRTVIAPLTSLTEDESMLKESGAYCWRSLSEEVLFGF
jgi:hypothetical protein